MMNYQDKTKDELIIELQKLRQEYNLLKTSYEKDLSQTRQVEDMLQEKEGKWRKLVTTIPVYIALHDPEGRYIFLNHYAEGFSEKDVVGKSLYDFISEDSKEEFRRNFNACLQTKQNQQFVYSAFGNNRVFKTYESFLIPIIEKDKVASVMAIAMDITERKMAEEALKESEARFHSLFENSLIGISTTSPDGKLLQINNAYARMYGYENPEMMLAEVKDVSELFANPAEREEVLRILRRYGFMEAKEFELIRRDRSRFFVLVSASEIRDADGKLLYNQATHLDLTERRKTEDKIRDVSFYARNLIEASLDPLVTINAEGKVTGVNLATENITGIRREKLIGSDFANYFTEPDKARKGYKIVFSKGSVKDYPLTIHHKSGRTYDVLYNATLFKNKYGEVQGVFAAARDITDRKKMEADLRTSNELLGKLNKHLNEIREEERALISREIHDELGQSMTALKLDLSQMHKYVGSSQEAIMKLDGMIGLVSNTIKNVQRISSDLRPGILDDLGLVSAIEWYCDEFEKRTGIKCSQKLENSDYNNSKINLTFFRALQETMTNVIRHACASAVKVRLRKSSKGTILTIADNGIGIHEEKIESLKSLGLIGMRERVRQFNGKVSISSNNGDGTKLTIFIPYK